MKKQEKFLKEETRVKQRVGGNRTGKKGSSEQ